MTNQQHPITPPPELVHQWMERTEYDEQTWFYESYIAEQAARWGADQELEACCEWFVRDWTDIETADNLRAARRPKPPSLKEEALALLDPSNTYGSMTQEDEYRISVAKAEIIRRALEQLDD